LESVAQEDQLVGARVRELRRARRLTLAKLAAETGLSIGYISQIERDLASPSVAALSSLANALDVTIGWFLDSGGGGDPSGEGAVVVRREARRRLSFKSGVSDELLCPDLLGKLALLRCVLAPGASSGDRLYDHEGEEGGYVEAGELDLTIEDAVYHLRAGDSFRFASSRPHRYSNPGSVETVVIWAMTPPRY